MSNFDLAFDELAKNEGGYVNNPSDPGGATNWGITARTAEANGYSGEMLRVMTRDQAKALYKSLYWPPEFESIPYELAFQVFDAIVNNGPQTAIKWLQEAIGAEADGDLGPCTMAKLRLADTLKTIMLFDAIRLEYFAELSTWDDFGKGWARRIASNLRRAAI
jgi:lysozyme family protein